MPGIPTLHYLRLEIKAISEAGEFEGWLSTYGNEDLGGDVIERGAFGESLKARHGVVRILLDHDLTHRAGTGFLTETPEGLHCRGVLNLDSPYGQQAYSEVKFYEQHGPPMEMSVGYKTQKDRWERQTRYVSKGDLWEGSLVCFGMNPQAQVTSVKAQEAPAMEGATAPATEQKAATAFEQVYRWMMLWEARYRMADALWASVESIVNDPALDEAGQTAAAEESLGQFGREVLAWMGQYREAYAGMATRAAGLDLELKKGAVLSARNKELVAAAATALAALLKAAGAQEEDEEPEEKAAESPPAASTTPAEVLEGADAQAVTGLVAEMRAFMGGWNHG
jgi:HK97 family phage prohead protease